MDNERKREKSASLRGLIPKGIVTSIILCSVLFAVFLGIGLFTDKARGGDNEVRVFCYGDYIDPELIKDFQKETGIRVIFDTFDTNEELYPIIKNRAGVYDVICPSDYMVERMRKEGLIQKIDFSKIPNSRYIGQKYYDIADKSYDPGNEYSVPYQFGIAGIMYNTKKIPEGSITSWKDLWNPEYAGKMLMQDSLRDTLMVGLKLNGASLNTRKEADLKKAVDSLIEQKKLVYKFANDSARDLLVGESADLGVIWNGEVMYILALNSDLDFVIPEEGTEMFIDSWCITSNAFHKENAEKWIDFMSRPDVAKKNFDYLTYTTPNEGARKLLSKDLQENEAIFIPDEKLENSEVLRDLGDETNKLYSEYWKKYKASSD